jgi:hypothetical protein
MNQITEYCEIVKRQMIEDLVYISEEYDVKFKLATIVKMAFWYCFVYSPYTILATVLSYITFILGCLVKVLILRALQPDSLHLLSC